MPIHSKVNPVGVVLCCWAAGWAAEVAYGLDMQQSRAAPSDAIAAVMVDASDGGQAASLNSLDLARMLSDGGYRLGLLAPVDESVRCWIDSLAALSVAMHYRLTVALLDVAERPRPDGGHELSKLSAALTIETAGNNTEIQERIAHLLRAYTNSAESAVESHRERDRVWYLLRDRRLPAWAEITWGPVGNAYLITIGPGSREQASRAIASGGRALDENPWFRSAFNRTGGESSAVAVYANLKRLQETADPALRAKVVSALTALGLEGASRTLFTFARNDRSVEIRTLSRVGETDDLRLLAGQRFAEEGDVRVPPRATGYAAIHWRPVQALDGVCSAYLSARSTRAREGARRFWGSLQADAGTSIERGLFAQLGSVILIHNFPEHALRLPLAWTIVVPIEGNAETVRRTVDQLLAHAAGELIPPTSPVRLQHNKRGIWYLSFGLSGPGVAVTDRHLVVSFSPEAVQENVDWLQSGAAAP